MKLNQIITSLLETDMYKFSMGEAIYHQFSDYKTTWTFKCRNTDVHFTAEMVQEIKEQIKAYCSLRFTEEELEYLNRITWIKGSYIDFLRLWQPRYEDFKISDEAECGLSIETFGTWLNTSLYEIPTLAIVNEVYFRMAYDYDRLYASFRERLEQKIKVPDKMSIIGIDDSDLANYCEVPLASVKNPIRELAKKAAEEILDLMQEKEVPDSVELKPEIINRSSVKIIK